METFDFISLGAGVQSTTMLLMAAKGEFEIKPKYAIFSDTGWEPQKVYDHLVWLKEEAKAGGIEVIVTDNGNIRDDIIESTKNTKKFASLPFFTVSPDGKKGMVRRQCTKEYKIVPVRRSIRALMGYKPRQRIKEMASIWMGITTDEIGRVKPSRERWTLNRYPLIEREREMSRADCLRWMKQHGFPQPPKSSCIGCPFHNDVMWADMKENDPVAFADAVFIDREIKKLPRFKGMAYLHRSCKPLDEVDFKPKDGTFDDTDYFENECEGMCGI